ncbi:MAG: M23 family metallopeptidase [Balneolaceae bacterium]
MKKILADSDGNLTVVVLDDQDPETTSTFQIRLADILKGVAMVVLVSVLLTTVIFFVTPLGSLYQHQQDEALRQQVIDVSQQVQSLRDSLFAQDRQLHDIKQVMVQNQDTIFPGNMTVTDFALPASGFGSSYNFETELYAFDMLSRNEIIFADLYSAQPDFPAPFPVDGTVSQEFDPATGHYGLDIAAREGSEFFTLTDGTVVNAGWTINYGYVIYVQHSDGYMSIYKHASRLFKQAGDIVLRGEILGILGDIGVLSFGSHLHLEIWKDGVPQNPLMYLTNQVR